MNKFTYIKVALFGFILVFFISSCKKAIEKAQEEAVLDSLTTGYWIVTKYMKGPTDQTAAFNDYKFQFKDNFTVDALKNSILEKTGSWQTNTSARTINANFTNATVPLSLLNGNWTITNSTWTSADATQVINGENCQLRLEKQ